MEKIKVLFFAANPEDTTRLNLDEEIREITQKIRASDFRDSLELISAWAVRPDDLLQYLNEHKPHIIHFSGHGNSSGEIVLLDTAGFSKPVSVEALKSLFSTLKDNLQLVVLNSCYSKSQATAITDTVGCAIGMNSAIDDRAAIIFAASFYRAIGFGRSVTEAFEQGKTAILLEGISENETPDLLMSKNLNSSEIIPVNPSVNWPSNTLTPKVQSDDKDINAESINFSDIVNTEVLMSTFGLHYHNGCFTDFKLGNELKVNFLLASQNSVDTMIRLIHLESPTLKPFTESGEYSPELNKAIKHIGDCTYWIEENFDYFLKLLTEHEDSRHLFRRRYGKPFINSIIIIGRRHKLSDDDNQRRNLLYKQTNRQIELTNYDRLIDSANRLDIK